MNAMLASGGYPWTVIRVEDRDAYLAALDRASIDADIAPFTNFIANRVRSSMKQAAQKVGGRRSGFVTRPQTAGNECLSSFIADDLGRVRAIHRYRPC